MIRFGERGRKAENLGIPGSIRDTSERQVYKGRRRSNKHKAMGSDPQSPHKKKDVAAKSCDPCAGVVETQGSSWLGASQPR